MTSWTIEPLAAGLPFGAAIRGLTRTDLEDANVRKAIHDLWIKEGVLLFRDGEDSPEMQVAVSNCFGKIERHLFPEVRVEGNPDLVLVKYWRGNGNVLEIDGREVGGWLPWHSDLAYAAKISRGAVLRPIELPTMGGGETGFIDQIVAYDRLPQRLKDRIEGLHGVYIMDLNPLHMRFGAPRNAKVIERAPTNINIMRHEWEYPRVTHPMVYQQKETGRKVLNVSPWFCFGIYEIGGDEGADLMAEVIEHCTSEAIAYYHDWKYGDMIAWDNWRTLHCATGTHPDDRRQMHRATIFGDYELGREFSYNKDKLERVDV